MEKIKTLPSLGFTEAVKTASRKLTDFNGRARRSELWWCFLLYCVLNMILSIFITNKIASSVVSTILLLLISSVTVRRLHDRGHSGFWVAASILLNTYSNFYLATSGYLDALATVNPDPDVALDMLKDPSVYIPNLLLVIINITILVFALLDSSPQDNKYGASPKYVNEEELYTV